MYDNPADLAWLWRHGLKRSALARDLARHERRQDALGAHRPAVGG
jgi:hypothetical protein